MEKHCYQTEQGQAEQGPVRGGLALGGRVGKVLSWIKGSKGGKPQMKKGCVSLQIGAGP